MEAFTRPLKELGSYEELEKAAKVPGLVTITGCIDPQKPHLITTLGKNRKKRLVVTFQDQHARELCEQIRFYDREAAYYPAKDILFYQSDVRGNVLTAERIQAWRALHKQDEVTLVTTFDALMNTVMPPENIWQSVLTIKVGDTIDMNNISAQLTVMGYEKEYQTEVMGQFAIRGGILDIFPLTAENPVRLELWGDEVDTIRCFDVESQKSVGNLDEIEIYPACELVVGEEERQEGIARIRKEAEEISEKLRKEMKTQQAHQIKTRTEELVEQWSQLYDFAGMDAFLSYFTDKKVGLLDFFSPEETVIFFDELSRSVSHGKETETEFGESMKLRLDMGYILPGQMREFFPCREIIARLQKYPCVSVAALDAKANGLKQRGVYGIHAASVTSYNGSFELLIKDLTKYKREGFRTILMSGSRSRAKRLADDLLENNIAAFYTENYDHELLSGQVMVCYGKIAKGYEYPILRFSVITETDIFGGEKKKKKHRRVYEGEKISGFGELSVGDYVVHENHGLGIYRGIEKIESDGKIKDYIKIEYSGKSALYILATQLDAIQKYAGKDAKAPKLNKLGGQDWNKTKSRVRGAVKQLAIDLVQLYAAREQQSGYAYGKDTVWQKEFEELFPFEETEDQELAIAATKKDMESTKIMDRLICGDVGYGKTEIAIRAAFKAVQESKQVAYLVPTTILAQQIYDTFCQRMKDFPVRVDMLSRFRSPAEQKKTIADCRKGQVDIVVGTHRLLSADVKYKDLGLLIIDEEQRFGVGHKEKIKAMKTNVDVLTLTATPIPRTLHMSLIGIRDMSVLEEAPMDRLPIQTYVMEYNEEMVREAISRELSRGGQVYYVYNRVKTIAEVADTLSALVPEANVAYAHGRMNENRLEQIMYDFINGEIDVLVSTTIIETGLDISNVNTMIIHDADNMGLSQLYQLRGRVGRSNRTAYAFLMYKRDKLLKEVAEKRLAAIREFSALGSGFKIAMRDLEIRGAGNLLGAEQSGQMEAVGYDLYCKMLSQAVREAKGIQQPEEEFETSVDILADAFIPASYIPSETQKLDIYKRIAGVEDQEQEEEMVEELIDRFGDPPKPVSDLIRIARLKGEAHRLYITEIKQQEGRLRFSLYEEARLDVTRIPLLIRSMEPALMFRSDPKNPCFVYDMRANNREKGKNVLELMEDILGKMEILIETSCEKKGKDI